LHIRKGLRDLHAVCSLQLHAMCSPHVGIQAFEIPDQQQAEIAARRQPWPALVRIEALAESFDVPVEVVLVEDLIQARVERMCGTARKVLGGQPHRCLLRMPFSFAHRHR
jgi:hypothetical protein